MPIYYFNHLLSIERNLFSTRIFQIFSIQLAAALCVYNPPYFHLDSKIQKTITSYIEVFFCTISFYLHD